MRNNKFFFLGVLFSFLLALLIVPAVYAGSNLVQVTSCNQVDNGVKITRFGRTYVLPNGCRDAGHGMRKYTLTCVNSTTYKVEWQEGCSEDEDPVIENGDRIRVKGEETVWFVNNNLIHEFESDAVYSSWFENYDGIKTISEEKFASYEIGNSICFRSGQLIDLSGDEEIYVAAPNCELRKAPSAAWLKKWFGNDWTKNIKSARNLEFLYSSLDKIADPYKLKSAPDGVVVKDKYKRTWYLNEGKKRYVFASGIKNNNFFDFLYRPAIYLPWGHPFVLSANETFLPVDGIFDGQPQSASLAVTTLSIPPSQDVAAGTTETLFSTVSIDASSSKEDVKVTGFEFTISPNESGKTTDIQNITFEVDGNELSLAKNGTNSTLGEDEELTVSLASEDQFVVEQGESVNLKIYADVSAAATPGSSYRMDITYQNNNEVSAKGVVTNNDASLTYSESTANPMIAVAAGGTLEVGLAEDNPASSLLAAGTDVTLAAFTFKASETEDIELDYIYLTQLETDPAVSNYKDTDGIWFEDEDGNEIVGTMMTTTSTFPKIFFADGAFVVEKDDLDGKTLYLKVGLADVGNGYNGVSGHRIGYKINSANDVVAIGASSGATSEVELSASAPTGNLHYIYKAYPVVSNLDVASKKLSNGTNDLFKFSVSAVDNDISLYKFAFDVQAVGCNISDLYLYDVSAGYGIQMNDTPGSLNGSAWQTDANDWQTNYSANGIRVSDSSPRTFILTGNLSGASMGSVVITKLLGDDSHIIAPLMDTAEGVNFDSENDFIWSDRHESGHSAATEDWTNGFLATGLPF